MKIMCKQEYYNQVVQYAESIKDTSLQNCMERLEAWEKNPDRPCEIELYHDWAPYSFGFTQRYPDGSRGIVGGLLYHGSPDESFAVQLTPFKDGRYTLKVSGTWKNGCSMPGTWLKRKKSWRSSCG